jgi:hypothetical protein
MSGPGRPTLYKPQHASRARELCPRGATNPDLLEPTLWVRQQNDGRKGRKGRKPSATIRRVGFVNDINHPDVRCASRFAPLAAAETGGNWRNPPAETLLEKLSAVSLSHPRGAVHSPIAISLAETAETPPADSQCDIHPPACSASTGAFPSGPTGHLPRMTQGCPGKNSRVASKACAHADLRLSRALSTPYCQVVSLESLSIVPRTALRMTGEANEMPR